MLRRRGGAHRSCRRRRTPRRGSLPRIARDRGQSLPGARTQAKPHVASAQHNCAAQLRNTISAFQQPTPKAALFGVQAYRGIRSRLTLGRRALRVRSFSGSQASRRNSNATVRRVCRMCAGRGMSQIGGQGATWGQCGVSHPPDRRSDLFSWPLEAHSPPPSKIGLHKSALRTTSLGCENHAECGGSVPEVANHRCDSAP